MLASEGPERHWTQALLDYLSPRQAEMVRALGELVEHESPSLDKGLLDALAAALCARLEAVGAEAHRLANPGGGDHVQAVVRPADPAAAATPPALVLCHFDTVWPAGTLREKPFQVEDGRARGPGVFDMKAGLVLLLFALAAIRDLRLALPRPVVALCTSDEEIGSPTSRALIEAAAGAAAYALVLESPLAGGVLKTARKGVGHFVLEVHGRAAHAGLEPEKGISAVTELAHQVLRLQELSDPSRGTTVNVGVVRGGSRANVVAARAEAEIDVRVTTLAEAEWVARIIRGLEPRLSGARLEVRGGLNRPPMERTEAVAALFQRAQSIGRSLGLELAEGSAGGASDGNFTAALGLPTLDGLGALGDGAHADHEHVLVDSLPSRAALLAALLLRL
ncbi:MAG: M20 family metallopeptidase [Chloroflexi bacterium]|nr:M20 family metallopeptidase [Chloroflexota bacterium]